MAQSIPPLKVPENRKNTTLDRARHDRDRDADCLPANVEHHAHDRLYGALCGLWVSADDCDGSARHKFATPACVGWRALVLDLSLACALCDVGNSRRIGV